MPESEYKPLNDHVHYKIVGNELHLKMSLNVRGTSVSGKMNTIVKCHEKIPGTEYKVGLNVNSPK